MAMNPQLMQLLQMFMGGGAGGGGLSALGKDAGMTLPAKEPSQRIGGDGSDMADMLGGGAPGGRWAEKMGNAPAMAAPGMGGGGSMPPLGMGGRGGQPGLPAMPIDPAAAGGYDVKVRPAVGGLNSEEAFSAMYERMMRAQLAAQTAAARGDNPAAQLQAEQIGQMLQRLLGDWDTWRSQTRADTLGEEERSRQKRDDLRSRQKAEKEQLRRDRERRLGEAEGRRQEMRDAFLDRQRGSAADRKSRDDDKDGGRGGRDGDGDGGRDNKDEFMGFTKEDFKDLPQDKAYAMAMRLVRQLGGGPVGGLRQMGSPMQPGRPRPGFNSYDSSHRNKPWGREGRQQIPGWLQAIIEMGPGEREATEEMRSTPGSNPNPYVPQGRQIRGTGSLGNWFPSSGGG